jgi:succinoglycan biosynthesis protein ExoM
VTKNSSKSDCSLPARPEVRGSARVAVCVITYRRPIGLEKLLRGLDGLRFEKCLEPGASIIVVDNDPDRSAQSVCSAYLSHGRWPVRYVHEPRRGIPQARNRALASVDPHVDFLVFIDDDEIPTPAWLDELLHVQREHGADAAVGPVMPIFEAEVPSWLRSAFDRERSATGERLYNASTANVLIRRDVLEDARLVFDERFALTGGEDTHLFRRMVKEDAAIVWADDALVHETIPATRSTLGWVLRRAFRTGSTWSTVERELDPRAIILAARVGRSLVWTAYGAAILALGLVRGRRTALRGARRVFWAFGCLAGLAGIQHTEYRTLHGS